MNGYLTMIDTKRRREREKWLTLLNGTSAPYLLYLPAEEVTWERAKARDWMIVKDEPNAEFSTQPIEICSEVIDVFSADEPLYFSSLLSYHFLGHPSATVWQEAPNISRVIADLGASPVAEIEIKRSRRQNIHNLLQEWLTVGKDYDEKVWPALKESIERERLSDRSRFSE